MIIHPVVLIIAAGFLIFACATAYSLYRELERAHEREEQMRRMLNKRLRIDQKRKKQRMGSPVGKPGRPPEGDSILDAGQIKQSML